LGISFGDFEGEKDSCFKDKSNAMESRTSLAQNNSYNDTNNNNNTDNKDTDKNDSDLKIDLLTVVSRLPKMRFR